MGGPGGRRAKETPSCVTSRCNLHSGHSCWSGDTWLSRATDLLHQTHRRLLPRCSSCLTEVSGCFYTTAPKVWSQFVSWGSQGAGVRPDHFLLFGRMRWNHARLSFLLPLRLFHLKYSIDKRLLTLRLGFSWGLGDDALDTHSLKNLVAAALLSAQALEVTVTENEFQWGWLATLCCLPVVSWSIQGAWFSDVNCINLIHSA